MQLTNSRMYRAWLAVTVGLAGSLCAGALQAQTYPSKPVRLIVPFAAGGAADNIARTVAEPLSERLGQPVVVENRAGVSGIIGTQAAARAAPDGYTFIIGTQSTHGLNPFFAKTVGYDPLADFTPVTMLVTYANVLAVSADSPYQNVGQLLERARETPGELSFGSSGLGSSQYLAGQMFQTASGADLLHIPYKGGAGAITDVIGGQITMVFETVSVARPMIESGRVRALGVTSPGPVSSLPDVPPIGAQALPGYEMESYLALFAPAGTPQEIVDQVHQALSQIVQLPQVRERLLVSGMEPSGLDGEALRGRLQSDVDKWAAIVQKTGIVPQ